MTDWTVEHGIWGPEPACQGRGLSHRAPAYTISIPFEIPAVFLSTQKTEGQTIAISTQRFHGGKELAFMINIIPKQPIWMFGYLEIL